MSAYDLRLRSLDLPPLERWMCTECGGDTRASWSVWLRTPESRGQTRVLCTEHALIAVTDEARHGACTPMGTNACGVAQCAEGHGDYPDACDEATP